MAVSEGQWRNNRQLWHAYVPDAHGIQLLTAEHVDKLDNLDTWNVSQVAPDRYLVEARDLEAWYAADEPAPEVLAAARRDFRDAILTPEIIQRLKQ